MITAEDALSEFMLMGDKAKTTLEEELYRMETEMNEPVDPELDEVEVLREQLNAARKIVEITKLEKEQTEERLEQVLDDAEQLRQEADEARHEREALEAELSQATESGAVVSALGAGPSDSTRNREQQLQAENEYLRERLERLESSQAGGGNVHATEEHPGDLFVEKVMYPRFNDLQANVKAIQEYLFAGKSHRRTRRGSTGSIDAVRDFVSKRVKRAKTGAGGEGELGRVMDDAEEMRVDLENALHEFLGSGYIEGIQVTAPATRARAGEGLSVG